LTCFTVIHNHLFQKFDVFQVLFARNEFLVLAALTANAFQNRWCWKIHHIEFIFENWKLKLGRNIANIILLNKNRKYKILKNTSFLIG